MPFYDNNTIEPVFVFEFFKIVYNELVSKANESKENIIIDTSSDLSVEQGINKILEFIKK